MIYDQRSTEHFTTFLTLTSKGRMDLTFVGRQTHVVDWCTDNDVVSLSSGYLLKSTHCRACMLLRSVRDVLFSLNQLYAKYRFNLYIRKTRLHFFKFELNHSLKKNKKKNAPLGVQVCKFEPGRKFFFRFKLVYFQFF